MNGIQFAMHKASLNGNGGGGHSGTSMSRSAPSNAAPSPSGGMSVRGGFSNGMNFGTMHTMTTMSAPGVKRPRGSY